jgi:N-acetylglucosamine-6-phosphate deacetylase
MAFALVCERALVRAELRDDVVVVIDPPRIVEVRTVNELPRGIERIDLAGGILAPGFIDVQVNGGGGALLNNYPMVEGVRRIAESHRRFGTTGMLPTVITDKREVLDAAVKAVADARAAKTPGVLGIHIEGPFIDPRRKGAHDASFIRTMTDADADWLIGIDCGVVMITVAPASCSLELIRRLTEKGIIVSIGHAECTAEEAQACFAAGARGVTHLFNAMSQLGHRAPGLVGAAIADPGCWCGIIADGHHVDPLALKIALAAKPNKKFMLVTDAMSPAAGGPDRFLLQGREVLARDDRLELADGTLAGANITMDAAVRYCVWELDVPLADALRFAAANPAEYLGLGHEIGQIAPGYMADLVHLGEDLAVKRAWIDGA